jgi:hypothetical protein
MSGKGSVWRKFFTMFVDDRNFALAIVTWIFAYWLLVPTWVASPLWQGVILFVGLAAILLDSVLRHARR